MSVEDVQREIQQEWVENKRESLRVELVYRAQIDKELSLEDLSNLNARLRALYVAHATEAVTVGRLTEVLVETCYLESMVVTHATLKQMAGHIRRLIARQADINKVEALRSERQEPSSWDGGTH